MARWRRAACGVLLLAALACAGPRYSSRIVHSPAGAIRGVIVEPASRRLEPVEAFLGVPYAARPPRLRPAPPAPPWPGTRLADAFAPVCPQAPPDISNKTAALARMPLGAYLELKALAPLLVNQSEDCLYLNIYVPGSGARGVEAPYAVVVWLGAGGEWGAGGAVDGAALAARARLLVVTLNYRVGLLGFLTTGGGDDAAARAGGAGVLDVLAALRWVRRAVAAFGGDPRRVTLGAARAAAATANALLLLPDAKGLVSRVLLLSGSALSPWALAPDAALARDHAAQALRCARDSPSGEHWLIECVESRPLAALLAVQAPRARFLAGWAPALPLAGGGGAGGAGAGGAGDAAARALHASEAFLQCALAVVVSTTESYHYFSEDDIRHGFEEEQRNRILRTYVRNVYRYHRNEIFAAVRNEYTDWERPIQHPINLRDATLEALSDAAGAAPALRLAQLHARRGATTYVAHFAHQTRDADYPQRLGSVSGEALPYFLGLPLVGAGGGAGGGGGGGRNYSRADAAVAEAAVQLLASFAKAGPASHARAPDAGAPAWPRYDLNTQQYLSIGSKVRVKSHYRGHKLALWLHLVPQLHRPAPPAAPRHHQFRPAPDLYAGEVFPDLYTAGPRDEDGEEAAGRGGGGDEDGDQGEECAPAPPRPAPAAHPPADTPRPPADGFNVDSHYYSYTVALGVTVGAGCFLLALNVLVFAGLYLQRARRPRPHPHPHPRHGSARGREAGGLAADQAVDLAALSPRKSTLKRSSESELKERPGGAGGAGGGAAAAPAKKRVQIQEISV